VPLHLGPTTRCEERDAVGHGLLHASTYRYGVARTQQPHRGVVERRAVAAAAMTRDDPEVDRVPVGMEPRRTMVHVDTADQCAAFLRHETRREEARAVERVVLVAHL